MRPADQRSTPTLTPQAASALRGGVVGNFIDQLHIFLPLLVLAPALPELTGSHSTAASATVVVMAMLLGRPIGGVIFGRLSDLVGRTRTTTIAIAGTAACTLGLALTPGHEVIGAAAIWWVLIMRFLGGIFIAGEYSAAIPLAMEWSRPRLRGLYSGLIMSMAPWAQAVLAVITWCLLRLLDPQAYSSWGWRLPFVASAVGSLLLLRFYRRRVTDRQLPEPSARIRLSQLLIGAHRRSFWQLFGMMTGLWLMTNLVVIALPSILRTEAGLDASSVAWVMASAAVVQAIVMAWTGHASTSTGRRDFFVLWGIFAALTAPVVWLVLVSSSSLLVLVALACCLQAVTVSGYGPVGAYLAESFPPAIRSTGYGSAYSLSIAAPALHPFWLPPLQHAVGNRTAAVGLLVCAGLMVAGCARLGRPGDQPDLASSPTSRTFDHVAS